MSSIVFYTTDCPNCKILESKLKEKNIKYTECRNRRIMVSKKIMSVPMLDVNGKLLSFSKSLEWINNQERTDDL